MTHPEASISRAAAEGTPDVWRERLVLDRGSYQCGEPGARRGTYGERRPMLCAEWAREGLWPESGLAALEQPHEAAEPLPSFVQFEIERLDAWSHIPGTGWVSCTDDPPAQPLDFPEDYTWIVVYAGTNLVRVIGGPVPHWHNHLTADIYTSLSRALDSLTPSYAVTRGADGRRQMQPLAFALRLTPLAD